MPHRLVSVFLTPAGSEYAWAEETVAALALEHGSFPFEPHLTLHSGIADIDLLREILEGEARSLPPLDLRALEVSATGEYFRTVFIRFEETPALRSLHEAAGRVIERERPKEFLPHVSLLYKEMPLERKREVAAQVLLPKDTFRFDRMKLVTLREPDRGWGDFRGWEALCSIPLKGLPNLQCEVQFFRQKCGGRAAAPRENPARRFLMNYRRRIGDILWHWSSSCRNWPDEEHAVRLSDDEYPENVCPLCSAHGGAS